LGTTDVALDGFVITAGSATASGNDRYGGGILCLGSDVVISNCRFTGNESTLDGGALFSDSSDLTVNNCLFTGNESSASGGALAAQDSSLKSFNCAVLGNNANNGGGFAVDDGIAIIANASFSGNNANSGGAIHASDLNLELQNTIIWNNHSSGARDDAQSSYALTNGATVSTITSLIENHGGIDPDFTTPPNPIPSTLTNPQTDRTAGSETNRQLQLAPPTQAGSSASTKPPHSIPPDHKRSAGLRPLHKTQPHYSSRTRLPTTTQVLRSLSDSASKIRARPKKHQTHKTRASSRKNHRQPQPHQKPPRLCGSARNKNTKNPAPPQTSRLRVFASSREPKPKPSQAKPSPSPSPSHSHSHNQNHNHKKSNSSYPSEFPKKTNPITQANLRPNPRKSACSSPTASSQSPGFLPFHPTHSFVISRHHPKSPHN
ncbi:MAG: right-handed parallel beta-helix repeat-containing protein, partial [Verrucomicrobiota bacterium]